MPLLEPNPKKSGSIDLIEPCDGEESGGSVSFIQPSQPQANE